MKTRAAPPFISVVIPTHNRLSRLRQTLACLGQQRHPLDRFEVIVVDDGSTDGTAEGLAGLSWPFAMRVLRQPNQGPAAARNAGARAAQGEIVAFTDDDCLPEQDWLLSLAGCYAPDREPKPVAVGGRVENVSDGRWLQRYPSIMDHHGGSRSSAPAYLDTANASFVRSLLLESGGFSQVFPFASGEDVEFGLRLTAAGHQLDMAPNAIVRHLGRTSVRQLLKQSYIRGRGNAILMAEYPQVYQGPANTPLRRWMKGVLDGLVQKAFGCPRPLRPAVSSVAAGVRRAAFDIAAVGIYLRLTVPEQAARCRALGLGFLPALPYLLLGCCDYLIRQVGQALGTCIYFYGQARQGRRLP